MVKYTILFLCSLLMSSTYAQKMGVKMTEGELPNTTLDVNGSFAFREASPLSVANGDNHNFALDSMSFYRVNTPTAAFSISGFTGGGNGRILRIANTTTQLMTLKHQNTNSTAANRLLLPNGSDLDIGANGSVTLQYSTGLNRWLVVGFTGASSNSLNAWGLTGNSNTNPSSNFIGTTDNVGLGLRTNNTEIVRITEGGKVGIGTTAPTSKLHIVGGDNTPTVNSATTNVLSRLTNSAGGSVVQNLETITGTGTRGIRIGINPTAATCSTPGVITFQAHSTVAGDNSVSDIIEYSFTDRNLILLPWTTNATKNVGIGTNVPDRKLSVVQAGDANPFISSASNDLMRFESTANGSAIGHNFTAKDATGATKEVAMGINPNSYSNNGAFVVTDAVGDDLLGYNLATKSGWTNVFGGNFGVGTQFPANKLDVYKASTTAFDGVLTITANPSAAGTNGWNATTPNITKASGGIQFKGWGNLNEGGIFRQTGSAGKSHMLFTVNSTNDVAMTITEGLRLGVGTTTPSQKLHVIGNILASGTITPSDARFKENITTLTGALTKIKQLRGVSYTHKAAFIKDHGLQQGNQIGFIAQELEQIFPEFVVTSADGYKAVDYARLTPVLVESLKEVNAKLEAQQAEINELKAAVKLLMNKR